jgi:hypothetical protein
VLNQIGIDLFDGGHPGSDDCYAVLNGSTDEANVIASKLGLKIRFETKTVQHLKQKKKNRNETSLQFPTLEEQERAVAELEAIIKAQMKMGIPEQEARVQALRKIIGGENN